MPTCPICSQQFDSASGKVKVAQVLSQHLENDHAQCFRGDIYRLPWRCSLCHGGKRNYAKSNGLAKHLLEMHVPDLSAAPNQAPAGSGKSPVRPSKPKATRCSDRTERIQPNNEQDESESGTLLDVPCLPWLPRPKWWTRPPSATVILATWNLEHFSYNCVADDNKIELISKTLLDLSSSDLCRNYNASVVVALQEVFSADAVTLLVSRLTQMGSSAAGGSGRVWHGVTSEPLGKNAERAAFVWSGPPPPSAARLEARWAGCCGGNCLKLGGERTRSEAPLHVDVRSNFRQLSKRDLETGMPRSEGDPHPFHFIRSPFFGLFRVGYANLVLINVHLAAGKKAARRELSTLNNLAEAIMGSNGRLLRRHLLGGRLKGRKPRGLVSVLGDFNCHLHVEKAPITTTTTTTITSPATTSTSTATTTATSTATTAASGGPGPVAESGHPQRQQRAGADPSSLAAITAAASRTSTLEDNDQNNDSDGGGNGSGGATGGVGGNGGNAPTMSNRSSWDVFLSNGWFNALCPQNSHGKPPPTNWRAQHLRDLDAICLKQAHGGLVKGSGVYALPPDVEPSQYPNHLLCWVLLDLEPLQGAPGKVRPLLQPAWPPGMAV